MEDKQKQQLAMMYFAICQMQIDIIDRLQGTSLNNPNLKKSSRKSQKECIKIINSFHGVLDAEQEDFYFKAVSMCETFIDAVKSKGIGTMVLLMNEFKNGEIVFVDEKKHGKFLKQQKRI